jgi:hypothetical protein
VRTSVIACGALGPSIREISARRGWDVEIHLLPSLLHNRPAGIAPRVERLATQLQARGDRVVLAYADCGTYGALDELCARYEMKRLEGLHCYDVFAGAKRACERSSSASRAPTSSPTTSCAPFAAASCASSASTRTPSSGPDYFANYRRGRLAGPAIPRRELDDEARAVAAMFRPPAATSCSVGTGVARARSSSSS